MEDPAALIGIFIAAISALFAALVVSYKTQIDRSQKMYDDEKADHKATRKEATDEAKENTQSIRELSEFIHTLPNITGPIQELKEYLHSLPKRREDFEREELPPPTRRRGQ